MAAMERAQDDEIADDGRNGAIDEPVAIGIDLGTSTCCVSVYRHGRVEIIEDEYGNKKLPAYVAVTERGIVFVGEEAREEMLKKTENNAVYETKRLIGCLMSDASVQADSKLWPFKLREGKEEKPTVVIQAEQELREWTFSPEEIAALLLGKLKEISMQFLERDVENVVITVPACFNDAQRQATKDAAAIAGFKVLRLLGEPTAAALACGLGTTMNETGGKKNKEMTMVIDMGAGSTDVSLVAMEDRRCEVIATSGDSHLGGVDVTNTLILHFLEEMKQRNGRDLSGDGEVLVKLREECERAKIELSSSAIASVGVDSVFEDGTAFQSSISRLKFEELNVQFFRKCMSMVEKTIKDANIDINGVGQVVLVGGGTRVPKIRRLISEFFQGRSTRFATVDPDEAVAIGAAIQAAILIGNYNHAGGDVVSSSSSEAAARRGEDGLTLSPTADVILLPPRKQAMVVRDAIPTSIGLEIAGGLMSIVVPRNSTLPTTMMKTFKTIMDNQPAIMFQVYEGDKYYAKDNHLLGEFFLNDLPVQSNGRLNVVIVFSVDEDGILTVSAQEEKTKQKMERMVSRKMGRLGEDDIARMMVETEVMNRKMKAWRDLEDCLDAVQISLLIDDDVSKRINRSDVEMMIDEVHMVLDWIDRNRLVADIEGMDKTRKRLEGSFTSAVGLPVPCSSKYGADADGAAEGSWRRNAKQRLKPRFKKTLKAVGKSAAVSVTAAIAKTVILGM